MDDLGTPTLRVHLPDQRVRVLISYTHEGLQEERRAVNDAIRDLKLHPLVLEDGTSAQQEMYRGSCGTEPYLHRGLLEIPRFDCLRSGDFKP